MWFHLSLSFFIYLSLFKLPFCILLDGGQYRIILARRQVVLNRSEARIFILTRLPNEASLKELKSCFYNILIIVFIVMRHSLYSLLDAQCFFRLFFMFYSLSITCIDTYLTFWTELLIFNVHYYKWINFRGIQMFLELNRSCTTPSFFQRNNFQLYCSQYNSCWNHLVQPCSHQ